MAVQAGDGEAAYILYSAVVPDFMFCLDRCPSLKEVTCCGETGSGRGGLIGFAMNRVFVPKVWILGLAGLLSVADTASARRSAVSG